MDGALVDAIVAAIVAELLEELDAAFLGPAHRIYCYRAADGTVPAREFLEEIGDEPAGSYAKSFQKRAGGHQIPGEKWRKWTEPDCEGLFEFKDIQSKSRILHTTDRGSLTILLYGFTGKKENKVDQVHVNVGKRLRDEYRARRDLIEKRITARFGTYTQKKRR